MEQDGDWDIYISVDWGEIKEVGLPDILYENIISTNITINPAQMSLKLLLFQNIPNPFSKMTTIKLCIPYIYGNKELLVKIQIFNSMGRLIKTLINNKLTPGYHSVTWDGTDINSMVVNPGIYMYRFSSGNFVESKKMLLTK